MEKFLWTVVTILVKFVLNNMCAKYIWFKLAMKPLSFFTTENIEH